MALSSAEYLIAVMTAFPLFFVVLVLFLFSEMTRNIVTRTELLPFALGYIYGRGGSFSWPRRILLMAKGWVFFGSGLGPSADIDMGFTILYPPQAPLEFSLVKNGIVFIWYNLKSLGGNHLIYPIKIIYYFT